MPLRNTLITRIIFSCLILSSPGWISSTFAQTVIYVDQAASGADDGTSWGDAFSGLQAAIYAASAGDEIWMAKGIYVPGDTAEARYILDRDIHLYGGFAGDETALDQRDPVINETVLSADVQGDDLPGDVFNFRWDNLYTILEITSEVTGAAMIDGFIFRGGHAVGNNFLLPNQWGGAMFCQGAPLVQDCRFEDNYADKRGGAIYVQSDQANGLLFQNCQFTLNVSNEDGGAIFINRTDVSGVFIEDCVFEDNRADRRGGAISVYNANSHLKGNTFFNNQSRRTGGAVHVQASFNFLENTIDSCTFEENAATRGGACYLVSSSVFGSVENHFSVSRSEFQNNSAVDMTNNPDDAVRGGAIVLESNVNASETSADIVDCTFTDNTAEEDGAAVHVQFDGQESSLNFAQNSMTNNSSGRNGPMTLSVTELGEAQVFIDSCSLVENHAQEGAAGLFFEAEGSGIVQLVVNRTVIRSGDATGVSGLSVHCKGLAQIDCQINEVSIEENTGAENLRLRDDNGLLTVVCRNSSWSGNTATGSAGWHLQGTGIEVMEEAAFRFENVLIHGQKGQGAVALVEGAKVRLVNATSAQHEVPGMEVGTDGMVELQNCILATSGQDELMDTGAGTILSLGGNIVDDGTFANWFGQMDLQETDPLFLGSNDFALTSASPAIDFGIQPDSIYPFDLAGNARFQGKEIDAGAYESPFTSRIQQEKTVQLDFWPNPASEWVSITLPSGWVAAKEMRIMDAKGGIFQTYSTGTSTDSGSILIALDDLPVGTFHIELINSKGERAIGTLIHQSVR